MNKNHPPLALTPGELAGIGPDLVIQLSQDPPPYEITVIANKDALENRAKQLDLPFLFTPYEKPNSKHLRLLSIPCQNPAVFKIPNKANAPYLLKTLDRAVEGCMNGEFSALVTGPIHKATINDAGIHFQGHTEYLAQITNTPQVVMMLATKGLRVALVTTHIPLSQVSNAITPQHLTNVLCIIHKDLIKHFKIRHPKMLICGLNPHAGEGGYLGMEEINIIEPVIRQLKKGGYDLVGPLSADTIFNPKYLEQADVIVAMYHDQGLPVLKYKGFGHGVNITLGLPFIRTSVDHGTAFDLVGTKTADLTSLKLALESAHLMRNSNL